MKETIDSELYEEQVGMMEMVLDVDDIVDEMASIRSQIGE
jgi:betaine reductase